VTGSLEPYMMKPYMKLISSSIVEDINLNAYFFLI
jgi:hypothetical protein